MYTFTRDPFQFSYQTNFPRLCHMKPTKRILNREVALHSKKGTAAQSAFTEYVASPFVQHTIDRTNSIFWALCWTRSTASEMCCEVTLKNCDV